MRRTEATLSIVTLAVLLGCPPDKPDTATGTGYTASAGASTPAAQEEDGGMDDGGLAEDASSDGDAGDGDAATDGTGGIQLDGGAGGGIVGGGSPFGYDAGFGAGLGGGSPFGFDAGSGAGGTIGGTTMGTIGGGTSS